MLKRRVWKGILAAVLAFSMLPTVALATSTTNTVSDLAIAQDGGTFKVTGKITKGASATIIVLKDTMEQTQITATNEYLNAHAIYIDQAAADNAAVFSAIPDDEVNNAFTFQFIPREGITGAVITAFVGGTNVSTPESVSVSFKEIAPTLTIEDANLVAGADGVVTVTVSGTNKDAWLTELTVGDVYGDYTIVAKTLDSVDIAPTDATNLFENNAATASYDIEIETPTYKKTSVQATIKNPAAAALETITGVSVKYGDGSGTLEQRENGVATLDVAGTIPATTTWTVAGAAFDVENDTISRTEGFELDANMKTVSVKASITVDGFTYEKDFGPKTVNYDGFAGAELLIGSTGKAFPTFVNTDANADVVKKATFTLTRETPAFSETLTYDAVGNTFRCTVVEAGDYTLTVSRPGYVDKAVTVTFTETGYNAFDWPAMEVATEGAEDLILANLGCADAATANVVAADLSGDNKVTLADYNILKSTTIVAATDATANVALKAPADIYTNDVFVVGVEANVAAFGGATFAVDYDAEAIELCDAEGNAISSLADAIKASVADTAADYEVLATANEAGEILYTVTVKDADSKEVANPSVFVEFYFKAAKMGATGLAIDTDASEVYASRAQEALTITDTTAIGNVKPAPIAPTATELKLALDSAATTAATELNVGDVVVPFYTFNNGVTSNDAGAQEAVDTTAGNVSEITWLVNGAEETANVAAGKLTITEDMVGATISYKVLAKADRDKEPNVAAAAVEVLEGDRLVVSVPGGYKPVIAQAGATSLRINVQVPAFEIGRNLTATTAYKNSVLTVDYKWYILDETQKTAYEGENAEGKAAMLRGLTPVAANYTVAASDAGKYGVATIKVVDSICGGSYESDMIMTSAYAISKAGNAPSTGGATLVPNGGGNGGGGITPPPATDEDIITPDNPTGDPSGSASGVDKFKDLPADKYAWAIDNIDVLAKAGIIKGMSEDAFEPEVITTQSQFVAMIVRALDLKADNAKTTLVPATHWSYPEIAIADTLGILSLFDGKFAPDEAVVRDQMFTIAYNALKAANITLKTDGNALTYTDASSIGEYATEAVEALTKAGIVNGMEDGTLAPKGTTTRAQAAKVVGIIYGLK